jgi:hypothetical protein
MMEDLVVADERAELSVISPLMTRIMSTTGMREWKMASSVIAKRGELKLPGRRSERCKDENKGQTASEAIYEYH